MENKSKLGLFINNGLMKKEIEIEKRMFEEAKKEKKKGGSVKVGN